MIGKPVGVCRVVSRPGRAPGYPKAPLSSELTETAKMLSYAVYKIREESKKRNMNIASEMFPERSAMLGSLVPMGYKWLVFDDLEVVWDVVISLDGKSAKE